MPLTTSERKWIADWIVETCPASGSAILPKHLAELLPDFVNDFRRVHPASTVLDFGVKASAAGMLYGPRLTSGAPDPNLPNSVIDELEGGGSARLPGFATLSTDERACEFAIVRGSMRPPGISPNWESAWPMARAVLFEICRTAIYRAVEWIGFRVAKVDQSELAAWTFDEAGAMAAQVRHAITQGCNCWVRDADFHTQKGPKRCATEHNLAHWDPRQWNLLNYVWRAALGPGGDLRLATHDGKPEVAMTNTARKGILVRIAAPGGKPLAGGAILKCNEPGCNADIELSDVCTYGHGPQRIDQPTWWLWSEGTRDVWSCCRCMGADKNKLAEKNDDDIDEYESSAREGCNGLYFRYGAECLYCGTQCWSTRTTQVYVPVTLLPDGKLAALSPIQVPMKEGKFRDELMRAFCGDTKTFAEALCVSGESLEIAAAALPSPVDDGQVRRMLAHINHVKQVIFGKGIPYWRKLNEVVSLLPPPCDLIGSIKLLEGCSMQEAAKCVHMNPRSRNFRRYLATIINALLASGLDPTLDQAADPED